MNEKVVPLGTAPVAVLVLVLKGQTLQPRWNLLFRLYQNVQQVLGDITVLVIVERGGQT